MRLYADTGIPTLRAALFDYMNSDDLRKLGAVGAVTRFVG